MQPESPVPDERYAATVLLAERAAVLILLAVLLYGVLRVLEPFGMAIAFGAFIAIGTWPMRAALVRRGVRPGAAAAAMLIAVILLIAVPAVLMAPGLAEQIGSVVAKGRTVLENLPPEAPAWLADLPLVGGRIAAGWPRLQALQGDINSLLAPYSGQIARLLVEIGQQAAASLLQILLALIVATMFWTSGERMAEQLKDIAGRLGGTTGVAAVEAAGGAVRGVAWGVVGTGMLQAVLMGIGLAVAGVPGAAVLAFLTMIFSISQVLGPLVIVTWVAAAAWLYGQGETGWALFMLVWGAIPVSGSDNIVRPLLIQRGSAMPLGLIILGVFGGLIAFGFLGLFIGPALLAVGHGLLDAWRRAGAGGVHPEA
ncbi:AI-2E family transporter [Roseomonas eburnea]|uniref:AI-2E family transporter n=1 Tax=Neoroseomonas eburnea TaxID=1346889 RepID=A0A9X9XDB1_9PROT|nr:AI-2E family transporter [Neoroseomonas eburnea]MBR0681697.1 AI-2E family transporter [Neoroseomonas eburnea]